MTRDDVVTVGAFTVLVGVFVIMGSILVWGLFSMTRGDDTAGSVLLAGGGLGFVISSVGMFILAAGGVGE